MLFIYWDHLIFTEGSPEFENKEHLFDFVVTFYFMSKFVRFSKACDQKGDRMSKNDEKLPYLK